MEYIYCLSDAMPFKERISLFPPSHSGGALCNVGSVGKESNCNAGERGDVGSILGLGRFPGKGNGNPLQYSCWRIPWTEKPTVYVAYRLQSMGSQRVRYD